MSVRIGELAREAGTTPRTVRYYEEIGLLPDAGERPPGSHREYGPEDVERLREVLRLKHMLGLSLDELKEVMHGEDARAVRRREYAATNDPRARERIVREGIAHTDRLLELVSRHKDDVEAFEAELRARRERQSQKLAKAVA